MAVIENCAVTMLTGPVAMTMTLVDFKFIWLVLTRAGMQAVSYAV